MCNVFCPFLVSVYLYCEGYKTINRIKLEKSNKISGQSAESAESWNSTLHIFLV